VRVCDEKPLEIQDYYFDSVEDFIKALANFKIFAITDKSTLKLYAKGKLEFHIHARFWRVSVFNDYRAILDVALDGLVRDQHLPRATKVSGARYHFGHGDQLVFISRVQFLRSQRTVRFGSGRVYGCNVLIYASASGWIGCRLKRHCVRFQLSSEL